MMVIMVADFKESSNLGMNVLFFGHVYKYNETVAGNLTSLPSTSNHEGLLKLGTVPSDNLLHSY